MEDVVPSDIIVKDVGLESKSEFSYGKDMDVDIPDVKSTEPFKIAVDCKEDDKDVKMEDISSVGMDHSAKEIAIKTGDLSSARIDYSTKEMDIRNIEPMAIATECKVNEKGTKPESEHASVDTNCKLSEKDSVMDELTTVLECNKEATTSHEKEAKCCKKEECNQEAKCSKEESECNKVKQRVQLLIEDDEDDDEEFVIMSPEEVRNFLIEKISEYMKDPEKNPILNLKKQALELDAKIKMKNEEFQKLSRLFEHMYHDQEKFLRHIGLLPKVSTCDFGVLVDMPPLPNSLSSIQRDCLTQGNQILGGAFVKAEAGASVVSTPTIKSKAATPLVPPAVRPVPPKAVASKSVQDNKTIECIDLTDDADPPNTNNSAAVPKFKTPAVPSVPGSSNSTSSVPLPLRHPAPLPPWPVETHNKTSPDPPPKPRLKISAEKQGIILQWDMTLHNNQAKISSYEIFGYQELKHMPISSALWVKIGLVQAMSLPMACTLTQFQEGHTYHFSIRAVDVNGRCGSYSDPATIVFSPQQPTLKNIKEMKL